MATTGRTDSSRKSADRTMPVTASNAITIAVRDGPSLPSTTKNNVNAAAVAEPFAVSDTSAPAPGRVSVPRTTPVSSTPADAPRAVHAAAVSESVVTSRRSLVMTYVEKVATEPAMQSTPVVLIETRPPPAATTAPPPTASASAATVTARSLTQPSRASLTVTTAGYT